MMHRAFTNREKALILFLAILMIVAAYYLFVHRAVVDALADIESQKSLTQTEIDIANTKLQKMQAMQAELDEIEADGVKSVVPEYDNLSREIVFLNGILGTTTDYTINFSGLTTSESVVRRFVNLSFTSESYDACCAIIEKLQNCEYCCRLGDVSMEPIREYNTQYNYYNGYGYYYDADYSILRNPLQVNVTMTFYERTTE